MVQKGDRQGRPYQILYKGDRQGRPYKGRRFYGSRCCNGYGVDYCARR